MSLIIPNPLTINTIAALTLHKIEPTIADAVFNANVLTAWLKRMGRVKVVDGAEAITTPLLKQASTTAQRYSGWDVLNITPQDNVTTAVWDWKQYAATVAYSGLDALKNDGVARVVNALEEKFEEAEMSLRNLLNGDLFTENTGTPQAVTGIATAVEAAAEAAQTLTLGGVPKSTLNNVGAQFWQNRFDNIQSNTRGANTNNGLTFSETGLDALNFIYDQAAEGNDAPDLFLGTVAFFENYMKSLQPQQRFTFDMGDARFRNVMFADAPLVYDKACTANRCYAINSHWMTWVTHRRRNFVISDPTSPDNQDGQFWKILWAGNVIYRNPRRFGVIINGDSF